MDVSISVVSYNTRDLLADCLRAISAATQRLGYEVIVVDNCSVDGSADMVAAEFPDVRLVRNTENRGFAAANNQALTRARGRYVLLLNSDAHVRPGAINAMVTFLDTHPRIGVVGGQLLQRAGQPREARIGSASCCC